MPVISKLTRCLIFCLLRALPLSAHLDAQPSAACPTNPALTARIANTAAGITSFYSGNTFLTIKGLNMPTVARAIGPIGAFGKLPLTLGGVTVLLNGFPGYIFSYSPQEVFVLMPNVLGCVSLYIEANGIAQFEAQIYLDDSAPGLFTAADGETALASHLDWSLITSANPAVAGERITLWAAGLGTLKPSTGAPPTDGIIPGLAAELLDKSNFRIFLNGSEIDQRLITYAGQAPGYAGLYQINVTLPANVAPNPSIRIATAFNVSPPRFLMLR